MGPLPLAATSYRLASWRAVGLAQARRGGWVCVANVHMCMEASDDAELAAIVHRALFTVPDSMPLVWAMRLVGVRLRDRVYGPTLSWHVLAAAEQTGVSVGLYGGREEGLAVLLERIRERCPDVHIDYAWSPPFRPLRQEERRREMQRIRSSGVHILLVGLGCPKQEHWMAAHSAALPGVVMMGVGAFFDFAAGRVRQAPRWMQRAGLEWLFRLCMEPKRLWRRYIYNNPRFVYYVLRQRCGLGLGRGRCAAASSAR